MYQAVMKSFDPNKNKYINMGKPAYQPVYGDDVAEMLITAMESGIESMGSNLITGYMESTSNDKSIKNNKNIIKRIIASIQAMLDKLIKNINKIINNIKYSDGAKPIKRTLDYDLEKFLDLYPSIVDDALSLSIDDILPRQYTIQGLINEVNNKLDKRYEDIQQQLGFGKNDITMTKKQYLDNLKKISHNMTIAKKMIASYRERSVEIVKDTNLTHNLKEAYGDKAEYIAIVLERDIKLAHLRHIDKISKIVFTISRNMRGIASNSQGDD